jgi:hypothetical protein
MVFSTLPFMFRLAGPEGVGSAGRESNGAIEYHVRNNSIRCQVRIVQCSHHNSVRAY